MAGMYGVMKVHKELIKSGIKACLNEYRNT